MRFEIRIRWRALIISVVGLAVIAALFVVLQRSVESLLGSNLSVEAALWFARIWFGAGILIGCIITRTYTSNADTEIWQMEEVELTKRSAAYEAEKLKRQEEKRKYGLKPRPSYQKKEGSGAKEE